MVNHDKFEVVLTSSTSRDRLFPQILPYARSILITAMALMMVVAPIPAITRPWRVRLEYLRNGPARYGAAP